MSSYYSDPGLIHLLHFYSLDGDLGSDLKTMLDHYTFKFAPKNSKDPAKDGEQIINNFSEKIRNYRYSNRLIKFLYPLYDWNIREKERAYRALVFYKAFIKINLELQKLNELRYDIASFPEQLKTYSSQLSNSKNEERFLQAQNGIFKHYHPNKLKNDFKNTIHKLQNISVFELLYDFNSINSYFYKHPMLIQIQNKYGAIFNMHLQGWGNETNYYSARYKEFLFHLRPYWEKCKSILSLSQFYKEKDYECESSFYEDGWASSKITANPYNDRKIKNQLSKIFNIPEDTTNEELKSAYKKYMLNNHPDRITQLPKEEQDIKLKEAQTVNSLMDQCQLRK